mmetsp:Transcript_5724/g.14900  ORF Transcript_5724/g.14900 Transcript_5724/m.14900 type:complete len:97 (+) Transcript_5724:1793-2083(+)
MKVRQRLENTVTLSFLAMHLWRGAHALIWNLPTTETPQPFLIMRAALCMSEHQLFRASLYLVISLQSTRALVVLGPSLQSPHSGSLHLSLPLAETL